MYCGGRTYFAPEHLALVQMWRSMWVELMTAAPMTREQVVTIVELRFPGDSFEQMVRLAQAAARRLQQVLDDAIENGRMVW